jgi:hypothetical protein
MERGVAVTRRYSFLVEDSSDDPSAKPPCFWIVDTEAELPTASVYEGCLAYSKDTDTLHKRTNTAWSTVGSGEGGGGSWGDITGTLANQTDLQSALDAKSSTGHGHAISDITSLQTALNGKANTPILDGDLPSTIARDSEITAAIAAHEGAADPHPTLQREAEKGAANGYASLDGSTLVPTAQVGGGTANSSTFLRGDRTWATPPGGGSGLTHQEIMSRLSIGI